MCEGMKTRAPEPRKAHIIASIPTIIDMTKNKTQVIPVSTITR